MSSQNGNLKAKTFNSKSLMVQVTWHKWIWLVPYRMKRIVSQFKGQKTRRIPPDIPSDSRLAWTVMSAVIMNYHYHLLPIHRPLF